MLMCTGGPPKAVSPSQKKLEAMALREGPASRSSSGAGGGGAIIPGGGGGALAASTPKRSPPATSSRTRKNQSPSSKESTILTILGCGGKVRRMASSLCSLCFARSPWGLSFIPRRCSALTARASPPPGRRRHS